MWKLKKKPIMIIAVIFFVVLTCIALFQKPEENSEDTDLSGTVSFDMQSGGIAGLRADYAHIYGAVLKIRGNRISEKNDKLIREAFAEDGFELLPEDKIVKFHSNKPKYGIIDGITTVSVTIKPVNMSDGGWLSPDKTVFINM